MRAVRFLPRARAQLRDIHTYIALGDAIAARAFLLRTEEAVGMIARNPTLGSLVSRRGVRSFPIVPYPYRIYYRVGRTVQILCVMHSTLRQPRFHEPAPAFARGQP